MSQTADSSGWSFRWWLYWWLLAGAAGVIFGPWYGRFLYPPRSHILDFYQDWSSARCFWQGKSIYTPLVESAEQFLGLDVDPGQTHLGRQSTHPPASVLPVLPLAVLGYPEAFLVWNLLSLGCAAGAVYLLWRELGPPWPTAGLGVVAAWCLVNSPLLEQVHHGQINLLLLLLIVLAWRSERQGAWLSAGMWLGTAAALKLMPAYLFLVPLVRRQWSALIGGSLAFLAWNGLAVVLFGLEAFTQYQEFLLPHLSQYRSDWLNASLAGFVSRLFDVGPAGAQAVALVDAPWLSRVIQWTGAGLITLLAARANWRASRPAEREAAWALTLLAMLLASPYTWEHYLVLLWPAVWLACQRTRTILTAGWLGLVLTGLLLHPAFFWEMTVPPGFGQATAQPWQSLTFIGVKFYALLGFFLWPGWWRTPT